MKNKSWKHWLICEYNKHNNQCTTKAKWTMPNGLKMCDKHRNEYERIFNYDIPKSNKRRKRDVKELGRL